MFIVRFRSIKLQMLMVRLIIRVPTVYLTCQLHKQMMVTWTLNWSIASRRPLLSVTSTLSKLNISSRLMRAFSLIISSLRQTILGQARSSAIKLPMQQLVILSGMSPIHWMCVRLLLLWVEPIWISRLRRIARNAWLHLRMLASRSRSVWSKLPIKTCMHCRKQSLWSLRHRSSGQQLNVWRSFTVTNTSNQSTLLTCHWSTMSLVQVRKTQQRFATSSKCFTTAECPAERRCATAYCLVMALMIINISSHQSERTLFRPTKAVVRSCQHKAIVAMTIMAFWTMEKGFGESSPITEMVKPFPCFKQKAIPTSPTMVWTLV